MARPNSLAISANKDRDGIWSYEGEHPDAAAAFKRYVREGLPGEAPEEFVRREFPGNGLIRGAAETNDWMDRRATILAQSRDVSLALAQAEVAESTRKFLPVADIISANIRKRLQDMADAGLSPATGEFRDLAKDAVSLAKALSTLQLSLQKQGSINVVQVNKSGGSSSGGPSFGNWGS